MLLWNLLSGFNVVAMWLKVVSRPIPKHLGLAALLLLLNACGQSRSELSFARADGDNLAGTPQARFYAIEKGRFQAVNDHYQVCFEALPGSIKENAIKLEIRLAFASWIEASFENGQEVYEQLRIGTLPVCDESSPSHSVVIRPARAAQTQPSVDLGFTKPQITCENTSEGIRCSGAVMRGVGSPAEMQFISDSNQDKPKAMSRTRSARAVFNPFIAWHDLSEEVNRNSKLADPIKEELRTNYASLLAAERPTYQQLLDYNRRLERHKIIESADRGAARAMDASSSGAPKEGKIDYTPESALMHTLLHEIGHIFGLMHADDPEEQSITGQSESTSLDPKGRQVTQQSVMARHLPYLYLMPDDRAGAKAVSEAARSYIDGKFE